MAYQSLYRRYRPRRFAELRGQEHVVLALRNAVTHGTVGHAYLFSGPRGTGKTSSARILAKVLNCEHPVDGEPCCECASCKAVEAGGSFDVHELDAASNNGTDAIKELVNKVALGTPGRAKVYILDEVHMLTRQAEAALLKTLEEPPAHVHFVLATTDPQKVSDTIRSRCQHLDFHLLPAAELDAHVRAVAKDAGLTLSDEAFDVVLREGGGSARDTLSALERIAAIGGVVEVDHGIDELVDALVERDTAHALSVVAHLAGSGRDTRTITESLVQGLRDAFLSVLAPDAVHLPERAARRAAEQGRRLGPAAAVRAMEVLGETLVELRHAPDPRILLDVALVRLTNDAADTSPAALAERIERLERQLAAGGAPVPASAASTAAPAAPATRVAPTGAVLSAVPSTEAPADASAAAGDKADKTALLGSAATRPRAPSARTSTPSPSHPSVGADPAPPAEVGSPATEPALTQDPAATASPSASAPAAPTPMRAAPATAPPLAPAPPATAPPAPAPPATAASAGGGLPSGSALLELWSDGVLPKLKPLVKALFSPARLAGADGDTLILALPNEPHRGRCEEHRAVVEAALTSVIGHRATLRLTVDRGEGAPAPAAAAAAGAAGIVGGQSAEARSDVTASPARARRAAAPNAPAPASPVGPQTSAVDDADEIDLHDLRDAGPGDVVDVVERLTAAFPGAELIEEEP